LKVVNWFGEFETHLIGFQARRTNLRAENSLDRQRIALAEMPT